MRRTPWWLWTLIIFIALMPLLIHGLRWFDGNPLPPGDLPYYHSRIASEILAGNIAGPDPLLPARTPLRTPLHFFLAIFHLALPPLAAMLTLPWLCGLAILLLLNAVLVRLGVSETSRAAVLLVLGFSPAFLSMAVLAEPAGLALALLLGGTYCLLGGKRRVLGAALLLMCASFGITEGLLAILVPLILLRGRGGQLPLWPLGGAAAMLLVRLAQYWTSEIPSFLPGAGIAHHFSDFGGLWGIPLFTFCLALVGALHYWRSTDRRGTKAAGVAVALAGMLYPSFTVYATPIIATFAGAYLAHSLTSNWSLPDVKRMFFIVAVCGIAFAGLSHALNLSKLQPVPALADGLIPLRSLPPEHGAVFSHPRNGAWIAFFANREIMLDNQYEEVAGVNRRYADTQAALYSTDLRRTTDILDEYGVTFVLITREMEQGGVWTRPDQGLLFLLQSNETFKRGSSTGFTSAWQYIGRPDGSP